MIVIDLRPYSSMGTIFSCLIRISSLTKLPKLALRLRAELIGVVVGQHRVSIMWLFSFVNILLFVQMATHVSWLVAIVVGCADLFEEKLKSDGLN